MPTSDKVGKDWERELSRYLTASDAFDLPVVTSRSKGAHTEEDFVFFTGKSRHDWQRMPISIEAKAEARFRPIPWLEQARRQADDGARPYVVIWKARNQPTGRAWVIRPWRGRWVMGWLDNWLEEVPALMQEVPF